MSSAAIALASSLLRAYPLLVVVGVWEAVARAGLVRALFLPSPSAIARQFAELIAQGEVLEPLLTSLLRAGLGLALALAVGITLGLAMATHRSIHRAIDPIVSLGAPVPKIAFVPIFVLWFGIDDLSKVLLVAFTCVFPILVATWHGASAVRQVILWSARSMGTSESSLLWRVVLPAAMPFVFGGIRVTVPVALITAYTAEMIAGGGGLGAALVYAQRLFQAPTVFVHIVLMLLTGIFFDRLLLVARRWLMPWEPV